MVPLTRNTKMDHPYKMRNSVHMYDYLDMECLELDRLRTRFRTSMGSSPTIVLCAFVVPMTCLSEYRPEIDAKKVYGLQVSGGR